MSPPGVRYCTGVLVKQATQVELVKSSRVSKVSHLDLARVGFERDLEVHDASCVSICTPVLVKQVKQVH